MSGCNSTHIISRRVEVNKQSEQNQLTSIWKTAAKVWWFLSVTTSEKTNHSKHKIISNAACVPDAMDIDETQRQWPIIPIHRSSKVLMHCQSTFHLCHDGKGGNKFSCFTCFLLHISSFLFFESNLIWNNNPQRKLGSFGVLLPH